MPVWSEVSERIAKTYEGSPEAESALVQLISLALAKKDIAAADGYLDRLPGTSAQRGQVELVVGRSLWTDYLAGMQELARWRKDGVPEGKSIDTEQARLNKLKTKAHDVLGQGVARMAKSGKPDLTLTVATLSLARMEIDLGQPAKAIALLEDPKVGPYTLVNQNAPFVLAKPDVKTETYRVALPAYLTAMASSDKPGELAEKARKVMDELEKATGTTPEGKAALLQTYQSLAKELQTQLETTPAGERTKLANAFSSFLEQVASVADSFGNLNWAADTFLAIAKGLTPEGQDPGPDAVASLDKAAAIYERILKEGEAKGASWLNPQVLPLVRSRMAEVRREQGKTDEALAILVEILRGNSQVLSVQREAALTLEVAAEAKADADMYYRAIAGTEKDTRKEIGGKPNPSYGRPIVWGWNTLAGRTVRYEQYRELFHEARFHTANCFFRRATIVEDRAEKAKNLEQAKKSIQYVYLQYPEMGGATWHDRYETLLKDIQAELREPTVGFAAFQAPATPPAESAAKS